MSGALFAIAAVSFRGGIVALDSPHFVAAATLTLAITLSTQTVLLTAWLLLRRPDVLRAILAAWRESLVAGFLGAFASEMWFLAFAIQNPARVRTLGLVEILVAGLVSRRFFAQTPESPRHRRHGAGNGGNRPPLQYLTEQTRPIRQRRASPRGRLKTTVSSREVTTSTAHVVARREGVDHLLDQHLRRRGAGRDAEPR